MTDKNSEIKVGDKVKVVGAYDGNHSTLDNTHGFDNWWTIEMDIYVSKVGTVIEINDYGVLLDLDDSFLFPPAGLEVQQDHCIPIKNYRMKKTKEPIRIICTDAKSFDNNVGLYMLDEAVEHVISFPDNGGFHVEVYND